MIHPAVCAALKSAQKEILLEL